MESVIRSLTETFHKACKELAQTLSLSDVKGKSPEEIEKLVNLSDEDFSKWVRKDDIRENTQRAEWLRQVSGGGASG